MECPKCRAPNQSIPQCRSCGEPLTAGDDPAVRMLIPVGLSYWAIASGYLALIIVTAPLAVITGILAIREIKSNPHKHGMGRAIFGIVFGGLVTLFYALIFVVSLKH